MKTVRDPFIDNARFILVTLVIFGHLISSFGYTNEPIFILNNFLASFRMPALIFITGFLAKNFLKDGRIEKITIRLFVPYLIFQYVYSIGWAEPVDWFSPVFAMWFLLSLYLWNLMLYAFTQMKHPILVSIVLGLLVGCFTEFGTYMSMSRTFVFFPFFLLGFYFKKEQLQVFQHPKAKSVSLSISALLLIFFLLYPDVEASRFLHGNWHYAGLKMFYLEGMATRLIFYGVMFAGIMAFLPWVPTRKTFFTQLGTYTAYIYILHISAILLLKEIGWTSHFEWWRFLIAPFMALGLALLLSSEWFRYYTRPFVTGDIVIIFKRVLLFIKLLVFPRKKTS